MRWYFEGGRGDGHNYRKTNRFFYLQHKLVVFLTVLLLDDGKLNQEGKKILKRFLFAIFAFFLILQVCFKKNVFVFDLFF